MSTDLLLAFLEIANNTSIIDAQKHKDIVSLHEGFFIKSMLHDTRMFLSGRSKFCNSLIHINHDIVNRA